MSTKKINREISNIYIVNFIKCTELSELSNLSNLWIELEIWNKFHKSRRWIAELMESTEKDFPSASRTTKPDYFSFNVSSLSCCQHSWPFLGNLFWFWLSNFHFYIAQILFLFTCIFFSNFFRDPVKSFMSNLWLSLVGGIIFFTTCMTASCSNISRSCFPWNFLLLITLVCIDVIITIVRN